MEDSLGNTQANMREWEETFTASSLHTFIRQTIFGEAEDDSLSAEEKLDGLSDILLFLTKHRNPANASYTPWSSEQKKAMKDGIKRNPEKMAYDVDIICEEVKAQQWIQIGNRFWDAYRPRQTQNTPTMVELERRKIQEELSTSFLAPFLGKTLTAFIETLHGYIMDTENAPKRSAFNYAQMINVLQSSGMGKSKLLAELGKQVYSITFGLGKPDGRGYHQFPKGDQEIYEYWTKSKVRERMTEALETRKLSYEAFLLEWNDESLALPTNGRRGELMKEIIKKAKMIENTLNNSTPARNGWNCATENFMDDAFIKQALEGDLTRIGDMIEKHNDQPHSLKIIMINFDEATHLLQAPHGARYECLRRVLCLLTRTKLWSAFLSTNSAVETFAPKTLKDNSDRTSLGKLQSFPPFTAFQTNIHADELEKNQQLRLVDLGEVKHLAKYGRPLWNSYVWFSAWQILPFVEKKLLNGESFSPAKENHIFSVLSFRICLNPMANEKSLELCRNSVNESLRVLVDVDHENRFLDTVTISEPLVSFVAAKLLNTLAEKAHWPAHWPKALERMTDQLLSGGKVQKGDCGEILSRVILILSYDMAISSLRPLPDPAYSPPLKVRDFLRCLLAIDPSELTMDSIFKLSENQQQRRTRTRKTHSIIENPRDLFDGHVNFNHFASTNTALQKDTFKDLLLRLFKQHVALQLSFNQQYNWDILIPVCLGPETEILKKEDFTAILVQVKCRDTPSQVSMTQGYSDFFKNSEPVLLILMELGLPVRQKEPVISWDYQAPKSMTNPHVAAITVRGLSEKAYTVAQTPRLKEQMHNLHRQTVPVNEPKGTAQKIKAQLKSFQFHTVDRTEGEVSDSDVS